MDQIIAEELSFSYDGNSRNLDRLNFRIQSGSFTVLLGRNGCGKSTLARHMNGLLLPSEGRMTVCDMDTADPDSLPEIRRRCGMVFQNPENQFVSPIVEEDLRFGLKNFGFPEAEIPGRVRKALEQVEMSGFERRNPQLLSGGQKQRIALAGILAVSPDILIFDEVTAMLDPQGRRSILGLIHDLHEKEGRTIIMITQRPEEAVRADRILLMNAGKIAADGTPREVLTDAPLLTEAGLQPPFGVRLWMEIRDLVPGPGEKEPLNIREVTDLLCHLP
ncbi:MAG: ATP-binding cassette domain-containing protein [Flexilinea sp.]|nr:ATP-binding cassette domain-containing protein [Flexilinea sp.]